MNGCARHWGCRRKSAIDRCSDPVVIDATAFQTLLRLAAVAGVPVIKCRWQRASSSASMNQCFFCGPTDNKITENVWPLWD
jgi:hypothetical protein